MEKMKVAQIKDVIRSTPPEFFSQGWIPGTIGNERKVCLPTMEVLEFDIEEFLEYAQISTRDKDTTTLTNMREKITTLMKKLDFPLKVNENYRRAYRSEIKRLRELADNSDEAVKNTCAMMLIIQELFSRWMNKKMEGILE